MIAIDGALRNYHIAWLMIGVKMSTAYILVVDDEPDIRQLVSDILRDEGYQVAMADNAASARRSLRERRPDLILLDIWMPDMDGISLLKSWLVNGELPCPVIMMSGHGTVETAVEATRLGAYDFLEKPLSLAKLLLSVEHALEARRLLDENSGLRRRTNDWIEPIGNSPVIQQLREQVKRIARHDSWVLISGEPGSGRETIARYLHAHSVRSQRPFIDIGVAAITHSGAALELFGRETEGHVQYGRLEQAGGGVLFLDEVADMDMDVQAQFVAALDSGDFLRVGGTEPVHIDARIIAATQQDLQAAVAEGRFREDLFYQLNVVPIQVPALRDRLEDVPVLLEHAVNQLVEQERLPHRVFSTAAQDYLRDYAWPGNVRELINLVQRILIFQGAGEISLDEVKNAIGQQIVRTQPQPMIGSVSMDQPLREARESFEKAYLQYHLTQAEGNVTQMAQTIGVERTHLYRKLRDRGVEIKERR
jgi:two-component system nitrogen regulation response regulator NtrX